MYFPDNAYTTIKEAQIDLLRLILYGGNDIEDTIEVNNISVCITNPLLNTEELFENVTPIALKHMDQMLLKPNYELEKTHFERLHNYFVIKHNEVGDDIIEFDQVEEIIDRLKENPFSKRCVLTLWEPNDISDKYAMSWTFSQLFIRDNKLIITNYFRSLDIWNGFPWNCLGIANLQEQIAKRLNIECGEFIIYVASAHIYKVHQEKILEYLST